MKKDTNKKKRTKKPREKKVRKDPRIECEYYEDVEITDPSTGKKTVQRVKIVRYKTVRNESVKSVLDEEAEDLQRTLDVFNA